MDTKQGVLTSDEKNLFEAIYKGNATRVEKLLKKGVNPNVETDGIFADTPIIFAAIYGKSLIANILYIYGADIHCRDDIALVHAAIHNNLELVKFFLRHKANIHNHNGLTLTETVTFGHYDMVKYLLTNGANVHENNDAALKRFSYKDNDNIKVLLQSYA